jgi:hypothetical protein
MKNLLFAGLILLACSACSKEDDALPKEPSNNWTTDHSNDAPINENVIFAEE